MTPLEQALLHAARGISVFPYALGEPDARGKRSKRPLTFRGHLQATTDEKQIRSWFGPSSILGGEVGIARVAVPTGVINGIWVLDVDDISKLFWIERNRGKIEAEWIPTSRGRHYYFAYDPAKPQCTTRLLDTDGLDTRGDGGWVALHGEAIVPEYLAPRPEWTKAPPRKASAKKRDEKPWPAEFIDQCLHAIDPSSMGRDQWRNLVWAALEAGATTEQLEEWTRRSPKWNGANFDSLHHIIDSDDSNRESFISRGTLLAAARETQPLLKPPK